MFENEAVDDRDTDYVDELNSKYILSSKEKPLIVTHDSKIYRVNKISQHHNNEGYYTVSWNCLNEACTGRCSSKRLDVNKNIDVDVEEKGELYYIFIM